MALPPGFTRLPSGSIRWRVQVNGRRVTGTAPGLPEAQLAAAQARISAGGDTSSDTTVGELVAMFISDADHAESTADRRAFAVAAIPDSFLARPAAGVSGRIVAALWAEMAAAGTGPHTIVKASHVLSRAFQLGMRLDVVAGNPIRNVKPPSPPPSKRVASPGPDDVRRLLEHFDGRPAMHAWTRFMAVCGARPGEICGLQWDDLDEQRSTVHVSRSINRQRSVTDGKNGPAGHRTVQLDLPTFRALRRVERVVGVSWIFTTKTGLPWLPNNATQEITRARDELGIKMRPYDLRHFAATQALAAGRPVPEVAYMLGDNPATVMKTYAHAIPGESKAASAVAAVLDG